MVLKPEDIEYIKKKSSAKCKNFNFQETSKEEECKNTIVDTYKEGYNDAYEVFEQKGATCGVAPNTWDFFNLFSTPTPSKPKRQQFRLPNDPEKQIFKLPPEETGGELCSKPFNLFQNINFNEFKNKTLIQYISTLDEFNNKTFDQYIKQFNIIKIGEILDFSKCVISVKGLFDKYIKKLDNLDIDINKLIINKLSEFKKCNLLKNINTMYFHNHNFTKDYAKELIPLIFSKFETVNILHFGVTTNLAEEDLTEISNNQDGIKYELIKTQPPYILATRISTNGGKRRKTRKYKIPYKKSRRLRKRNNKSNKK